jgi:hypothetical protein
VTTPKRIQRQRTNRDRWRSIPGPIRREVRASDLRSLQEAATSEAGRFARPRQTAESTEACWSQSSSAEALSRSFCGSWQ